MLPRRRPFRACLGAGAAAVVALAVGVVVIVGGLTPARVQAVQQVQQARPDGLGLPDRQVQRPASVAPAHPAQPATHRAIDPALQQTIADRMSHATAGQYGVVVDVAGVGRVASIHPGAAMRPASTQKLFTLLPILLDRPLQRLVTNVVIAAKPVGGVVHGNLVVRSAADPSLLGLDLTDLAKQARAAGVRRVTEDLVLDIGSRPTWTRQQGWKSDFVPDDVGPLSPFPVHQDTWRHDSAYLSHPTRANLALFRSRLAGAGVRIQGSSRVVRSSTAKVVVASHTSVPLRRMVKHTLLVSDNFYAETLLVVGGGHRRVNRLVADVGVTDTSSATDGSGLSYDDRETARGEVQLLDYAHAGPAAADLLASLPVACRSGTLQHRFCKTIAAGKVFAKTGTLSHTTALAGYTSDGAGRLVTFAVICSGVRSIDAAVRATDRVVLALRHYAG